MLLFIILVFDLRLEDCIVSDVTWPGMNFSGK
jgi:hypothetical protein